jgi:hypothetical protein
MTLPLHRNAAVPFATSEDRGQAAFTRAGSAVYDLMVLRALCPWVWPCPSERIVAACEAIAGTSDLRGVGSLR